ncbi:MAG: hypothetical protein J6S85_23015 [Methanobrevibacter sp.]|nr:hypothetical protein [Methanobrevibacter sp.]
MAELNHVIELEVGDWSKDGHNQSDTFLFKSNYSGEEIDKGFERLKKEKQIDFKKVCHDYEDSEIKDDVLVKLIKLGVLTQEEVDEAEEEYDGRYCVESALDLAALALDTLHAFEPAFEWEEFVIPNKEYCYAIQGIGYGCYF